MTEPEKIKLREALGTLTVKQTWTIFGIIIGLLGGSFGIGFKVNGYESTRKLSKLQIAHQGAVTQKDTEISQLKSKKFETETQIRDMKVQLRRSEENFSVAKNSLTAIELKTKFLDHFVRYAIAKTDYPDDYSLSKNLFANFVHEMWRTQEQLSVEVAFRQRTRTDTQPVQVGPVVTRKVIKKTTVETVLKTVTFSDGSSYIVPDEISRIVHSR